MGQAVILETRDTDFPYLVSAPTMRVPMDVSRSVNAFLAFRAVIRAVRQFNAKQPARPIVTVLCPGLGTAIGRMAPKACALQMYHAYRTSHLSEAWSPPDLMAAARHQIQMIEGWRASII